MTNLRVLCAPGVYTDAVGMGALLADEGYTMQFAGSMSLRQDLGLGDPLEIRWETWERQIAAAAATIKEKKREQCVLKGRRRKLVQIKADIPARFVFGARLVNTSNKKQPRGILCCFAGTPFCESVHI